MPKMERELIRAWLEDHRWTVQRLAAECNALGLDTLSEGTMADTVNGIDPMGAGSAHVPGTRQVRGGIPYAELVDDSGEGRQ